MPADLQNTLRKPGWFCSAQTHKPIHQARPTQRGAQCVSAEHTSPNSWRLLTYLKNTCAHICPSAHIAIPTLLLFHTPRPAHQQMTQPHGVTTGSLTSHMQAQTLTCTLVSTNSHVQADRSLPLTLFPAQELGADSPTAPQNPQEP